MFMDQLLPLRSLTAAATTVIRYDRELNKAAMESALDAVAAMQAAVTSSGSQMRVLVASIRDASDMATLAARVSRWAEGHTFNHWRQLLAGRYTLMIIMLWCVCCGIAGLQHFHVQPTRHGAAVLCERDGGGGDRL